MKMEELKSPDHYSRILDAINAAGEKGIHVEALCRKLQLHIYTVLGAASIFQREGLISVEGSLCFTNQKELPL